MNVIGRFNPPFRFAINVSIYEVSRCHGGQGCKQSELLGEVYLTQVLEADVSAYDMRIRSTSAPGGMIQLKQPVAICVLKPYTQG